MQRREAIELFDDLLGLFPSAPELTPDAQSYWIGMLERDDPEVAARTANAVLHECKFFPSVAEWQEKARDARAVLAPQRQQAALPAPTHEPLTQSQREAAAHWLPITRETIKSAKKPSRIKGVSTLGQSLGERQ